MQGICSRQIRCVALNATSREYSRREFLRPVARGADARRGAQLRQCSFRTLQGFRRNSRCLRIRSAETRIPHSRQSAGGALHCTGFHVAWHGSTFQGRFTVTRGVKRCNVVKRPPDRASRGGVAAFHALRGVSPALQRNGRCALSGAFHVTPDDVPRNAPRRCTGCCTKRSMKRSSVFPAGGTQPHATRL